MKTFLWGVAALTVWGDLIKPYLPAEDALALLYASACLLLVMLFASGGWRLRSIDGADASLASNAALFLVAVYFFQWSLSVDAPAREGLNHLLYMAIPLGYLILIPRCQPHFDHVALANRVLLLMIPVNVIGVVQYTVDPTFFISTAYSGESGGVIRRNLLYGSAFERFPSLYASADRYSAMALMQFCYSIILLQATGTGRARMAWIAFNVIGSLAALGISGARSRILIVFALAAIVAAVYFGQRLLTMRREKRGWTMAALSLAVVAALAVLIARARAGEYSVFVLLQQSLLERDLTHRIEQAVTKSLLPTETSAFGEGLGSIGVGGKPGEFGIHAIWAESGVIWGSLLLLGFAGIGFALARSALASLRAHRLIEMALPVLALLTLATALLTGLTSAFELSSGVLLACAIVLAVRHTATSSGGR